MKIDVGKIFGGITDFVLSEGGQRFICGTYSNGKPRSLVDAARDEYISPKDRENWEKRKKKKKKKSKKKKKLKSDFSDIWNF